MTSTISGEDRAAIRDGFARLMAEKCTEADVRRIMASESGHDAALWSAMSEMGIPALLVPEAYGGIGGGAQDIEVIMEEAGAALLAGPLLGSAVLAVAVLTVSNDEDARQRLLPALASGEKIAAVAATGDAGSWDAAGVEVTATQSGNGWTLSGVSSFVLCANIADVLLVIARTPEGLGCFEVAMDKVAPAALQTWDPGLRLARIEFGAVDATPISGFDEAAFENALDMARVALAGEQAGACRRIFEMTVDYLKTRVQFGRAIGSFQAMKHMAADLLIEVESATSAARGAAQALADDTPDKDALVGLASFACADAFSRVAADAIQMHGGIAFTWEHPAHLYLRRARADAQLFGQSDTHRERFVASLENAA